MYIYAFTNQICASISLKFSFVIKVKCLYSYVKLNINSVKLSIDPLCWPHF